MKPLSTIAATLLLAIAPLAQAIQPTGMLPPSRPGPGASDLIERGGTVNAVDAARHALVIDGAPYAAARGGVRIHLAANRTSGSLADLKRGMQIRFTSVQDGASAQPQVREVWVTGAPAR